MTTPQRDRSTRHIEDQLNRPPAKGWRPDVGDRVIGPISDVTTATSQFSPDPYPVLRVETQDGPVSVHAFHAVLKSEVARLRPTVGDTMGIKYLGVPAGKRYEAYTVVLDRPDSSGPDWDAMQASAEAETAIYGEEPF